MEHGIVRLLAESCENAMDTAFFLTFWNFWRHYIVDAFTHSAFRHSNKMVQGTQLFFVFWTFVTTNKVQFVSIFVTDHWETSPNVRLALLCLCAVKTFFELPFHIIYWHPNARLPLQRDLSWVRWDPISMQPSTVYIMYASRQQPPVALQISLEFSSLM